MNLNKRISKRLLLLALLLLNWTSHSMAQTSDCNLNFDDGTTSSWILGTGTRTGATVSPLDYTLDYIPDNFYHTITPGAEPPDFVPLVFNGTNSLKLGSMLGPDKKISIANNSFWVTECNTKFTFSYALVLEDAFHETPTHTDAENDAFFSYRVNSSGGTTIDATTIVANLGSVEFDFTVGNFCIKNWTTVTLDLSAYVGEEVFISFMTADCVWEADEAVAYIDCQCPSGISEEIDGATFCTLSSYPLPDPYDEGEWSGPMVIEAGGNEYFSPTTSGVYTLTFCYGPGCCEEATVTVGETPIPLITNINHTCEGLCDGSIELESLTGTCTWVLSGPDGFWDFADGEAYSKSDLCAGEYMLEAIESLPPNCRKKISFTIEDKLAEWHKTTENTSGMESGNDIVTDAQNNVYVVGTYHNITELQGGSNPNITLDPLGLSVDGCMYLAKYDPCGTLLWAARASTSNKCTGNSLTLDESNGMVYVTGDISQDAKFHSSESEGDLCVGGISIDLISSGDAGYVAQYDMNSGCLYFVEEIVVGDLANCRTITTNESTGDIFIGGRFYPISSLPNYYAFIKKYEPETALDIGNTLGIPVATIIDNVMSPSAVGEVNDLDYDEVNNRLYAIGSFEKDLSLFNGTGVVSIDGYLSWKREAFVLTYEDFSASPFFDLRSSSNIQGMIMTGEGISVSSETGVVYLTGSYKVAGTLESTTIYHYTPFSLAVDQPLRYIDNDGLLGDIDSDPWASYMISMDHAGISPNWVRFTNVFSNDINEAKGKDVTCKDGNVVFLNNFTGSGLNIASGGGFGASLPFIGNPSGNEHIGVISYTETGIRNWLNVTESATSVSDDDHNGMSITTDNSGLCFVTGGYQNEMGYFNGAPVSGNLVKTGPGMRNAFIVRVKQDEMGAFQKSGSLTENSSEKTEEPTIKIAPNPNNGIFELSVSHAEKDEHIKTEIFDLTGKMIFNQLNQSSTIQINLIDLPAGLYTVRCSNRTFLSMTKLIKID
ncbi:MAG: hypothetical protein ACJA1C_000948 [Crocinitomicaceae bacterium]|jgi:hypothetical protein